MEECDVRLARILLEVTAHVRDHLGHRLLVAACLAAGDDLALFEGEDGLDVTPTADEGAGPANAAAILQELEGRDREEGEARLADALELLHGLLCGLALVAQPYGNLDHVPQANTGGPAVENRDRHIDGVGGDRGRLVGPGELGADGEHEDVLCAALDRIPVDGLEDRKSVV